MKLHQLQTLIALVDAGSIRGAARALDLTQPALTSRIAELESEVGATLVNRTVHGTTLTAIGRALLVHARTIDNQVRRAEDEIAQLTDRGVASVAIGASPLAAIEIVAPVLRDMQAQDPHLHLRVDEGQFQEMSRALREGALDMVIAPIPLAKQGNKTFHFEELVAYPMYVVARVGHPLSKSTRLAALVEAKWVAGAATSPKRSTAEELFLEHGLPKPQFALQADAITMVQSAIAESELLGLLPRPLFDGWSGKIAALPIADPIRPLRLGLIMLAGTPLSPIAQRLAALVRERAKKVAKGIASQRRR